MAGSITRMRKLIRWIEKQPGWRVRHSRRGGHCMVLAPDGVGMATVGMTPHGREWANTISDLNKIGLTDIPTF